MNKPHPLDRFIAEAPEEHSAPIRREWLVEVRLVTGHRIEMPARTEFRDCPEPVLDVALVVASKTAPHPHYRDLVHYTATTTEEVMRFRIAGSDFADACASGTSPDRLAVEAVEQLVARIFAVEVSDVTVSDPAEDIPF